VNLFRFVPGYESAIYERGKEPLFFLFLAFLICFACTRGYTRLARTRGWGSGQVGGTHLHHIIPGILLAFIGGLIAFTPPGHSEVVREVGAILFGAGGALVLDEFALVFRLRDVYWLEEGRSSVTATLIGVTLAGLLLLASSPFDPGASEDESRTGFFVLVSIGLFFAVIAFLKGKPFLGVLAIFTPFAWLASIRLATPKSPWARWFYDPSRGRNRDWRARKLARSQLRFERNVIERFERWFVDLVGGKPLGPFTKERK
jgi:hypothetical protein